MSVSVISQARLEGVQDTAASGCWEELRGSVLPVPRGHLLVILRCLQPEKGLRALTSLVLHCEGRDLRAPGLSPGEKEAKRRPLWLPEDGSGERGTSLCCWLLMGCVGQHGAVPGEAQTRH